MTEVPTSPWPLRIIIVGAGVSGLVAAISSALAGHNVLVLEAARELAEVRVHVYFEPPLPACRNSLTVHHRLEQASRSPPTAPGSLSNLGSTTSWSQRLLYRRYSRCGGIRMVRSCRGRKTSIETSDRSTVSRFSTSTASTYSERLLPAQRTWAWSFDWAAESKTSTSKARG